MRLRNIVFVALALVFVFWGVFFASLLPPAQALLYGQMARYEDARGERVAAEADLERASGERVILEEAAASIAADRRAVHGGGVTVVNIILGLFVAVMCLGFLGVCGVYLYRSVTRRKPMALTGTQYPVIATQRQASIIPYIIAVGRSEEAER